MPGPSGRRCHVALSLLAASCVCAVAATGGSLLGRRHRHLGNIFAKLVADFERGPKDKGNFEDNCVASISKLLPALQKEYTGRQVPVVLYHECDVYTTAADFHHLNASKQRAVLSCKHFARTLVADFQGNRTYKGWCDSVLVYLNTTIDDRAAQEQYARIVKNKTDIRRQLDGLKGDLAYALMRKQYEEMAKEMVGNKTADLDEADAKALDEYMAGREKRSPLLCCPGWCRYCPASDNATSQAKDDEEDEDDDEESDEAEGGKDDEEDEDDDEESDEAEGGKAGKPCKTPCKPKAKTPCRCTPGVVDGEALHVVSMAGASRKEVDDEEGDDEDEEDEDEDEDDDDESGEAEVSSSLFLQRRSAQSHVHKKRRRRRGHNRLDVLRLVVGEFQHHPDKTQFLANCSKVLNKLLPDLQSGYTWRQVPNVLSHSCDVYGTSEDFRAGNMTVMHAQRSCKYFAWRLVAEFRGEKNYERWCGEALDFLEQDHPGQEEYAKRVEARDSTKRRLDQYKLKLGKLSLPCCPKTCRVCA